MASNKYILYFEKWITQELFVLLGLCMAVLTLGKLEGWYTFSSDWLWFIAAIGLTLEGTIGLIKQKKFDRKYVIIERTEFENAFPSQPKK